MTDTKSTETENVNKTPAFVDKQTADVNKLLKNDADDTKKILHSLINPEKKKN